jgi:GTP-binding protein
VNEIVAPGEPGDEQATLPELNPDLIERARVLFAGPIEFLKSAPALQYLPDPDVPEIAFCGRSNVGKSSLLNALTGRNSLARTSITPGRTQELNFFDVGEPLSMRLVDMPGYGFAKAPPAVVEKWKRLVRDFLRGRVVLKRTLLLIDARHGPKAVDIEMMQMLDGAAMGYRLVLTKADKIKASDLAAVIAVTETEARKHPAAYPVVHVTSAETKLGVAELRGAVLADAEI